MSWLPLLRVASLRSCAGCEAKDQTIDQMGRTIALLTNELRLSRESSNELVNSVVARIPTWGGAAPAYGGRDFEEPEVRRVPDAEGLNFIELPVED